MTLEPSPGLFGISLRGYKEESISSHGSRANGGEHMHSETHSLRQAQASRPITGEDRRSKERAEERGEAEKALRPGWEIWI